MYLPSTAAARREMYSMEDTPACTSLVDCPGAGIVWPPGTVVYLVRAKISGRANLV